MAVSDHFGINTPVVPQIATGFCSGVARTGGMCGALSGAIMAIGVKKGRKSPDESVEEIYDIVQRLLSTFEAEFGSMNCQQLINCDLRTEAGMKHYLDNDLEVQCLRYTQEATRMTLALLDT
jgi:C_GCAxxG_C_C family probable redox protein